MRVAKLTGRQERFVSEYMKDLNATQAAIRAGYSAKTADVAGPRLLGNVRISTKVAEAQATLAERNGLTVEQHLEDLLVLRQRAVQLGQIGAAIQAEVNRGKVCGFYVERVESNERHEVYVVEAPPKFTSIGKWQQNYANLS